MPKNAKKSGIELLQVAADPDKYLLRLYIAGHTPRSMRAVENLKRIVANHLPEGAEVEVIDIYQQGQMARDANVIGAPTLVKQSPLPLRRLVGDLSDEDKVLLGLNLKQHDQGH